MVKVQLPEVTSKGHLYCFNVTGDYTGVVAPKAFQRKKVPFLENVAERPDHYQMEYEPKYTVVLRGQEFVLTKSQIEFDSPNYFTACFLGDFREGQTKRLVLTRNLELFQLVVEHLCGYEIFPLDDKTIPSHMPPDAVLRNLRADALFYQLDGLVKSCDEIIKSSTPGTPPSRSYMVIGFSTTSGVVNNANAGKISERFLKDRMGSLQLAESHASFSGLRATAVIEAFARKAVGDYHKLGWTLMCWRVEIVTSGLKAELLIVLEALDSRKV
ncbi:hypothetical protein RSAG8_12570, partial [Rhizoctonia solani AG-8 WAC10335]